MKWSPTLRFAAFQVAIVVGAMVAYFGVRGVTEADPRAASRNAERVLDVERAVGLEIEQRLQDAVEFSEWSVTLANWVYMWGHWPVVISSLIWLAARHRPAYVGLRNAMIISGLIGLVIFATFPVAPPRLYSADFVDTVTERAYSYRVLQPPAFVNRYAAMPSLHFGWNLLVGIAWYRLARSQTLKVAAFVMPAAMAWAVVATANHWVLDVVAGGAIALCGLLLERALRRRPRAPLRLFGRPIAGGPWPVGEHAAQLTAGGNIVTSVPTIQPIVEGVPTTSVRRQLPS